MTINWKAILTNRYAQLGLAFVIGGTVATFMLPTKEIIKKETVVETKVVTVEKKVVQYVDRVVYRDRDTAETAKTVTHRVTSPDGTITEDIITESTAATVDRLVAQEREAIDAEYKAREEAKSKSETYEKVKLNPKRFNLFGGMGIDPTNILGPQIYLGGMNATIWGPFTLGLVGSSQPMVGLTIGITF